MNTFFILPDSWVAPGCVLGAQWFVEAMADGRAPRIMSHPDSRRPDHFYSWMFHGLEGLGHDQDGGSDEIALGLSISYLLVARHLLSWGHEAEIAVPINKCLDFIQDYGLPEHCGDVEKWVAWSRKSVDSMHLLMGQALSEESGLSDITSGWRLPHKLLARADRTIEYWRSNTKYIGCYLGLGARGSGWDVSPVFPVTPDESDGMERRIVRFDCAVESQLVKMRRGVAETLRRIDIIEETNLSTSKKRC